MGLLSGFLFLLEKSENSTVPCLVELSLDIFLDVLEATKFSPFIYRMKPRPTIS